MIYAFLFPLFFFVNIFLLFVLVIIHLFSRSQFFGRFTCKNWEVINLTQVWEVLNRTKVASEYMPHQVPKWIVYFTFLETIRLLMTQLYVHNPMGNFS